MAQHPSVSHVRLDTGVSLAYTSTGPSSETPVLLLHAWVESRRSFDRLLPLVHESVHTIAIDQRGHGDAERPENGYTLDGLARDVEAFLDALEISSAVLVGSSSGGYVAQQVAIRCPSRVAGLVLIGAPISLRERPPFADQIDALTDPIDPDWVRRSLTWFPRFTPVPEWYVDDRVHDGARVPAHVWRATFDGLIAATPPTDVGTITAPTLIVCGDRDGVLPGDQQAGLAAAIPHSRLVVYADTGHLVLWERPERLGADIASFVETLGR